jgi:L-ascorbate metabolism protein UlaG (beta-lactamase superfamily)
MKITKFRHACLHVQDGDASILIDPGVFSADAPGLAELTGLSAVLITHAHPDHVAPDLLGRVLGSNPDAAVFADPDTAEQLSATGLSVTAVEAGTSLDVGTDVRVLGGDHAVIHRDIPVIPNRCYLVGGRLLHPGDSLTVPDVPVEILAVPAMAPWMAVKEAVDYLRAVAPRTTFPIHEQMLSSTDTVYRLLSTLAPDATDWVDLDDGATREF